MADDAMKNAIVAEAPTSTSTGRPSLPRGPSPTISGAATSTNGQPEQQTSSAMACHRTGDVKSAVSKCHSDLSEEDNLLFGDSNGSDEDEDSSSPKLLKEKEEREDEDVKMYNTTDSVANTAMRCDDISDEDNIERATSVLHANYNIENFSYDMYERPSLHNIIASAANGDDDGDDGTDDKWKQAEKIVKQNKTVKPKQIAEEEQQQLPEVLEIGFADEGLHRLPLHYAVQQHLKAPASFIKLLLNRMKLKSKLSNSMANVRDATGSLPLHICCQSGVDYTNNQMKIVEHVLDAYPNGVWYDHDDGSTRPLHLLLEHKPSLALVDKFINAASSTQHEESPPASILGTYDIQDQTPLHVALTYHANASIIERLIILYPKAQDMQNNTQSKDFPIHVAAYVGCTRKVLHLLTDSCIVSIEKKNGQKETPIHLLFHPDNLWKWMLTDHDDDAKMASSDAKNSSGCDDDDNEDHDDDTRILKPIDMFNIMIKKYYDHFNSHYNVHGDRKKKKTKSGTKRKNNPSNTVCDANGRIKKLLSGSRSFQNNAKRTIQKQAQYILDEIKKQMTDDSDTGSTDDIEYAISIIDSYV